MPRPLIHFYPVKTGYFNSLQKIMEKGERLPGFSIINLHSETKRLLYCLTKPALSSKDHFTV